MSTTALKAGDRVKYVGPNERLAGLTGTITGVSESGYVAWESDKVGPKFSRVDRLELITAAAQYHVQVPAANPKKVGDRVRFIYNGYIDPAASNPKCGSLGTVTEVMDELFRVKFDNISSECWCRKRDLGLIHSFETSGQAICTKCNYKNDYASPDPNYVCFNCR